MLIPPSLPSEQWRDTGACPPHPLTKTHHPLIQATSSGQKIIVAGEGEKKLVGEGRNDAVGVVRVFIRTLGGRHVPAGVDYAPLTHREVLQSGFSKTELAPRIRIGCQFYETIILLIREFSFNVAENWFRQTWNCNEKSS